MSANSFEAFIQFNNETAAENFKTFMSLVENENFRGIYEMGKEYQWDFGLGWDMEAVENEYGFDFSEINAESASEILHTTFNTRTVFNEETFEVILNSLGVKYCEFSIYYSQVGEYTFFMQNEEFPECEEFSDYKENEWKWLKNPMPDFEDEAIVITGRFEDYSKEELQEIIEEHDGDIQSSVNEETTMLVVGSKPDASELSKAKELGIKIITEEQFLELIEWQ